MWAIAGILFAGGFITYIEAPYMIKKRMIKELYIFFILLFIGLTVSILQAIRIRLPNPLDLISVIYKPISDLIFGMLQ
jgi:hypothetical protein